MFTKTAYPIFIQKDSKAFLVYIPDWDIFTEGTDYTDAIGMARDAIGLKWSDDLDSAPVPSSAVQAKKKAKREADDDTFKYSEGLFTLVDVDVISYNERLRNRAVRKNCTIPYWLNEKAEMKGVNFSKVLQDALLQLV